MQFAVLYYCNHYTLGCPHVHGFRFSKTFYLRKGQCWLSDPSQYLAGNCGSALYVPLGTFAVCNCAHSSYTCVVCQLKVKIIEGKHIIFIHHIQCIVVNTVNTQ